MLHHPLLVCLVWLQKYTAVLQVEDMASFNFYILTTPLNALYLQGNPASPPTSCSLGSIHKAQSCKTHRTQMCILLQTSVLWKGACEHHLPLLSNTSLIICCLLFRWIIFWLLFSRCYSLSVITQTVWWSNSLHQSLWMSCLEQYATITAVDLYHQDHLFEAWFELYLG